MSRKMFLLLVTMFTMVFFVNAEENAEEAEVAETKEVAPGNKKEANAEIKEIDAVEKAKEANADANIKDEGKAAAKEIAEDKAAGKEEAAIDNADAEKIEADASGKAVANKKSGSWFSWLWPFGSDKKTAPEEAVVKEAAPEAVVEEATPEEAVVEEVAVAEDAEGDIAVEEEVAVVAEPKVNENAGKDTEKQSVMRAILLYVPNVLLNLTDIISVGLGAGAESGAEVRLTRWCQIGGMYGDTYFVEKGFDRRYGGGYDDGYNFQLVALASEKRYQDNTFGGVSSYICKESKARLLSPNDPLYKNKNRDFWAIGVEGGWLIKARVDVHPVEIADFLASLIALDITGDNLK